jgi:4-amino-4-deoxy-L-arabinose transferase-like glycosyltransferase
VSFASLLLEVRARQTPATPRQVGLLGLSLGLLLLSKGTGYVLALPLSLWLAGWGLRSRDARAIAVLAAVPVLALALNASHLCATSKCSGRPSPRR